MLKIFILTISLSLLSAAVLASDQKEQSKVQTKIAVDYSVEKISLEEVQAFGVQATCFAETYCPNGRYIFCRTYGNNCTWWVQPRQYVSCTGYNNFGQWVTYNVRCY